MKKHIEDFLGKWVKGNLTGVEIYNEFSFQFELGEYLRNALGRSYKVQFERNISDFFINEKSYKNKENLKKDKALIKGPFQKKEIDIVVFKGKNPWETSEKYAIELKYIMPSDPTSDKMHEMLEDIAFTQQLVVSTNYFQRPNDKLCNGTAIKKSPFNKSYAVVLCDRKDFWYGKTNLREKNNVFSRYKIFRTYLKMNQVIDIELDKRSKYLKSTGKGIEVNPFTSKWVDLTDNYKYYIVEA